MTKLSLTFIAILISIGTYAGDILTLTNSMVFEGKITKVKDCTLVFKTDNGKFHIPATDVASVVFGDHTDKVYTNYLEKVNDDPGNCLKARLDAENYHGKKGGHFVLGVLFGPFAMIGTALANPKPEKGKNTYLFSENKELFDDPMYLSCYRKKAKGQLISMEALGWGSWLLLLLVL
ncbi:hypothetical protein [Cyclobacterium qasimii]|uniref:Uncharacterized protein n=2 Tax=Cyclobacterium qasimii TaxID=1350429 RepID=S7WST3_9BACT|nr:hypothetical protein [Cyclobacterium qasimii]EPR69814.1 hypothetical protein ADICYQ_1255 [Cyclobacterium qasimii M12-11B]GEO24142.1 hypothetical protein CQA01_46760 [Cyclobacterium qasimii]